MANSPDYAAVIAEAIGRSDEALNKPEDLSAHIIPDSDTYDDAVVRWFWKGYVQRGKIHLVDASASSGKTRFMLALAACAQQGCFPFDENGDPFPVDPPRTLYFSSEDEPGELKVVYKQCGGNPKWLYPYSPADHDYIEFNNEGLERLEKMILAMSIGLVVIDPILEFGPSSIQNQSDNKNITKFLSNLRPVIARTNVACLAVRHWALNTVGKSFENLAAGGGAWRSGARGQSVIFKHPGSTREWLQILVIPARGSLLVTYGKPFCMEVKENITSFIRPENVDWDVYCEKYPVLQEQFGKPKARIAEGTRGPASEATQETAQALLELIANHPNKAIYSKAAREILIQDGHADRTIYRAKDALVKSNQITDVRGMWTLNDTYDPFENDGPPAEEGQQYWQDL